MILRCAPDTVISTGIVAVAIAAVGAVVADTPSVIRVPLALLLLLLVPGLAVVRVRTGTDWFTTVVLAVAVSLSLDVVIAMTLLYLHVWSVVLGLIVLAVVAAAATFLRVTVRRTT